MRVALKTSPDAAGTAEDIWLSTSQKVTVGRQRWADVVVDDTAMDALHFSLETDQNACWIRDLRSGSGIRLNGIPVLFAELFDGDLVEAGHSTFTVAYTPPRPQLVPKKRSSTPGKLSIVRPGTWSEVAFITTCDNEKISDEYSRLSTSKLSSLNALQQMQPLGLTCIVVEEGVAESDLLNGSDAPVMIGNGTAKVIHVADTALETVHTALSGRDNCVWLIGAHSQRDWGFWTPQLSRYIRPSALSAAFGQHADSALQILGRLSPAIFWEDPSTGQWTLVVRSTALRPAPPHNPRESYIGSTSRLTSVA